VSPSLVLKQLPAESISVDRFASYGQLITPANDGKLYDATDARLNLTLGIPRFYIMRLTGKGQKFSKITRHSLCTQCLGSIEGQDWSIAVAPPSDSSEPDISKLKAFRIEGNCFIKLEVGTWHAGPYFDRDTMDFYNLELSDTNIIDHFTYDFAANKGWQFEIITDYCTDDSANRLF
jgi:ureidoglycolate hydrolase